MSVLGSFSSRSVRPQAGLSAWTSSSRASASEPGIVTAEWIAPRRTNRRMALAAEMRELRAGYGFEYVVGSVHHVDEVPIDVSQELFDEAPPQTVIQDVVDALAYAKEDDRIKGVHLELSGFGGGSTAKLAMPAITRTMLPNPLITRVCETVAAMACLLGIPTLHSAYIL